MFSGHAHSLGRLHIRRLAVALLFIVALSVRQPAVGDEASKARSPETATVSESAIQLPVIEGSGLRFTHLSTSDGLSQTRVSEILQGDKGFMWFGTQYGLNRYDGYEFRLFVHDPHNTDSLSGAYIYALFKDRMGMFWIGCNRSLDKLDPHTERFTHYRVEESGYSLASRVVHISQDRTGMLWLATGTGLHRLDPMTGQIKHFRHDANDPASLDTNDVNWSGEDREGRFWVGTANGLDQFDREKGQVLRHIPIPDAVRISLFEARDGTLWIIHASGTGLAAYDAKTNIAAPYTFYPEKPPADGLTGLMGVVEDANGDLWLASPGKGLLHFDRAHRHVVWYRNHPNDVHSIGEDKAIALFQDDHANIWVALHSSGIAHFSERAEQFESFKHDADDPNSLTLNFVNEIFDGSDGTLWIGNDDGINRIDRSTGKRTLLTAPLPRNPMVISIGEDRQGWMWFGTFGDGLRVLDPHSGIYKIYRHDPHDPGSLSNNEVRRVFVDHAGTVWIATDDGLDKFDPSTGRFRTYKVEPQSRLSQSYARVAEDSTGILWLGSTGTGLHRFDPKSGEFTVFRADPTRPEGLRDDSVPAVYVDKNDMIWVGTQNGLTRMDPRTRSFKTYDTHDGLPGNTISCITDDSKGNLWMSTNHGLSRLDSSTGTFENYTDSDGLPGNDFTGWSTCHKGRDGELFFGGFAGAVGFYPDKLTGTPERVPIVLTGLEVAGETERAGDGGPLEKSISYTAAITLTHQENEFSLRFAGLHYASPFSNRYRYRLLGLDHDWIEVDSSSRRASYTTLPPGHYTFQVQAASAQGTWIEPGESLQIRILPPWWATWWFRTLYVAAGISALWIIYRMRIARLSHQMMLRMQERVDERTRISQELHDTLLQGLLSASLQLSVANSQLSKDAPAKPLVERVFGMLRKMTQESRNVVSGLRVQSAPDETLEGTLARLPLELAPTSSARFEVLVEGSARPLKTPIRDEMYWIARECVANAFRHANANSIEVVVEYSVECLRLVVRDDGEGIEPAALRRAEGAHWGLAGIGERAQRIGAKLEIASAAGAGTEVDVKIPARLAYGSSAGRRRSSLSRVR